MDKQIKDGVIHIHSENSLKDSAQKIPVMVNKCAELGARGIVLTDHGTLTGLKEFINTVDEYNENHPDNTIKCIPGVEAYYEEDDDLTHRKHLVLIPKDLVGLRAVERIVTRSNERLDSKGFPRVNTEILSSVIGPEAYGHDHVIACSACMAGVLASLLLSNKFVEKQIVSFEKKQKKLYSPNAPMYLKNKEKIAILDDEIASMTKEAQEQQKIAKKPFKKKENAVKALEGSDGYEEAYAALEAEKADSENAGKNAESIKEQLKKKRLQQKELKEHCKNEERDHIKWNFYAENIANLQKEIVSDDILYERAKNEAIRFQEMFGKGNFYIELQNHRIPEEIHVFPLLAKIADELNIPLVATNDAHMTGNSPEEIKARQIMRSLRFNKWENIDESDKELYIKTDKELSSILAEILPAETVKKAMAGIGEIIDKCNVNYQKINHYPKFHSDIEGETARAYLLRLAREGIAWRYPNPSDWTEEHEKRFNYEMEVIEKLDVIDYLCIVEDFLKYGRLLGKVDLNDPRYLADPFNIKMLEEITKDEVGLGIGPGRGSAVGSIICYLIGITGLDPMKYNLLFERFLNPSRVTMPDIDSDFKPDIRARVIEYVKNKYGKHAVCCIMTRGTQGVKAGIRNAARLLGDEKFNDIKVYYPLADAICKLVPTTPGVKFKDCIDALTDAFADNKDALEIIENAQLIEGTFTNVGMHAAGVIISDNGDVGEYVPLMYNTEKKQWMAQVAKEECEEMGLLKMDFLGLINLGIITDTIRAVKNGRGEKIEMSTIPIESAVLEKIFATGNTNSVFQFESGGMKQMLRQFKPSSIEDVILLVAAYRPGPMQYLNDIIAVKQGKKEPDYVIPEMETVLGTTYGYPVYQEQIMQIFNKFAGFSLGESDIIRRYMSKKKTDKFAKYKDKFIDGLIESGAERDKAMKFWDQLLDFSKYAFNKSHACAYAFVAYYTAFLKYHYPVEYLTAVMNNTVFEKLGGLINDCKIFGIKVTPADINTSEEMFSISSDGNSIQYGLSLVKNVGNSASAIIKERKDNGNFISFADFMVRTKCRKDVAESLIKAGAFDNFVSSRAALLNAVPEYTEIIKKIADKKAILDNPEKTEKSKTNAQTALDALQISLNSVEIGNIEESGFQRLKNEKEMTGAYITGYPLDSYKKPNEMKCTPIEELTSSNQVNVFGIISDVRETQRKKDGAKMAFFKLEDITGIVDCNCFTDAYAQCGDMIKEDAVVKMVCKCSEEFDEYLEETVTKLTVKEISPVEEVKPTVTLFVPSVMAWTNEIRDKIRPYQSKNGYSLIVFDMLTGVYRKTNICVSSDILNNKEFQTSI